MSWTYISSLDEYDKQVTKDSSTPERYTFKRYMYFKPDQYDNWSKSMNYTGIPYTAELVGNANIPSAGTYLTGSLSQFYVGDVVSIRNMSEEEHGDHCSYAKVTIEYENKPSNQSGSNSVSFSSSQSTNDGLKPWERKVEDFQITNQEIQVPFTSGYIVNENAFEAVATTAGQPLYGFTISRWVQRLTWTFNSRTTDYSIPSSIINSTSQTLFNHITIPAGCGLLLPPSYKQLYYYKNQNDRTPTEYDQWNFEIIVDSRGFDLPILNCGTKAIMEDEVSDICHWYVYDPTNANQLLDNKYGPFDQMMDAKAEVDEYNKNIQNELQKKVFNGDFIQAPIPLDYEGKIDTDALIDATKIYVRRFAQYEKGVWNLGIR